MRRRAATVFSAALIAAISPSASANHLVVTDGNDTRGRVDIKRVEMRGLRPRNLIITTQKGWSAYRIYDKGFFLIFLDTFGDTHFDYFILLRSVRTRIKGEIWRHTQDSRDRVIAITQVHKGKPRKVRTSLPLRKMHIGNQRVDFRWYAKSMWIGSGCRRVCFDRAPNEGAVTELIVPEA